MPTQAPSPAVSPPAQSPSLNMSSPPKSFPTPLTSIKSSTSPPPTPNSSLAGGTSSPSSSWIVPIAVTGLAVGALVILAVVWLLYKFFPRKPDRVDASNLAIALTSIFTPITSIPYEELKRATNEFLSENVLGEGGFGCVYKGNLNGREVAVKKLQIIGAQGEREFRAEVEVISRVHHRHLVSLVGYCIEDSERLLVYEYVSNGTLEDHLHGRQRPVINWPTRLRIAIGTARGIAYLHEDCHPRIFHRDIKSSNILLDDAFVAQVSDFGLAKFALDAHTHVITRVMGTFGYIAPEYASTGRFTEKSDVFSFGVVLLEFVTGRKALDASRLEDQILVEWARPLLSHALTERNFEALVDPRLENNFDQDEIFRMIKAAEACVRHSAETRPQMGQVLRALESAVAIADLNNGVEPAPSTMPLSSQEDDMNDESVFETARNQYPSSDSESSASEYASSESQWSA